LNPVQEQPIELQEEPLLPADLPPFMEQYRYVVEIPQLRGLIDPLQPVVLEREQVIFEGGAQHVRRPTAQGSSGQGDVPRQLTLGLACENPFDGRLSDLLPGRGEQLLVVRLAPVLTCQLQVTLGLAVQVAFQDFSGDLRGHDSAPSVCSDNPACLARSATS